MRTPRTRVFLRTVQTTLQPSLRSRVASAALPSAVLLCIAGYLLSAGTLYDHDCLVMGEVARRVAEGQRLYAETWDNKPPLALLFYLPAQFVAPGSYLAQQVFCALWTLLQGGLTFRLLSGESRLVREGATCLVLLMPLSRLDFAWASSEDAVNLFTLTLTLLGYRMLRRGDFLGWEAWLVGGATVLGFHARQTGAVFALLPCLAVLLSPQPWRRKAQAAGAMLGGALVGAALVLALVFAVSDFAEYVQAVFVGPRRYGKTDLGTLHWVIREQLTQARGQVYGVLFLFALLLAQDARQRMLVLVAAAAGVLCVLAPSKPFGHYQEQLIPALILMAVVCLKALEAQSAQVAQAFTAALVLFFAGNVLASAEELRKDEGVQDELNQVVSMLEAASPSPDERLLAMGENSAYFYFKSKLKPVHRFHWDLFFDAQSFLSVPPDTVVEEILSAPPAWFVLHRQVLEQLRVSANAPNAAKLALGLEASGAYEEFGSTPNYRVLRRRKTADAPVSQGLR